MKSCLELLLSLLAGCGSPSQEETAEQYMKNPVGCERHPADWFAAQVKTQERQAELRALIKRYQMRAGVHETRYKLTSVLSDAERRQEVAKGVTCLGDAKYAGETLVNEGLPPR